MPKTHLIHISKNNLKKCLKTLLILIFLCVPSISFSQKKHIEHTVSFKRNETYSIHNVTFNFLKKNYFSVGVGIGINKTILQQRFSPLFAFDYRYKLTNSEKLNLFGIVNYDFNTFIIDKKLNERIVNNDFQIGYSLSSNKKISFIHSLTIGTWCESYQSKGDGTNFNNWMFNYKVSIGIKYEIN